MASQTISNTVTKPDGSPASGCKVTITPIRSATGAPGGLFVSSSGAEVLSPLTTTADGSGKWTVAGVIANADTADASSYYRVDEQGVGFSWTYFVQVPNAGGPYTVNQIQFAPLATVSGTHGAASHAGDILPDASEQTLGAGSITIDQRTAASVPTPGATQRTMFTDSADGKLKVKLSDASVVDLEAGGTSGLSGGVPALTLGTANAAGSGSSGIRTNATIAIFDTTAPTTVTPDAAAAAGGAAFAARRDHQHGMATSNTAALPTTTGAGTPGTAGHSPSRDDHTHQIGAHGATEHTDITRSIFLPMVLNSPNDASGTATPGAAPDVLGVRTLADAATQGVDFLWALPKDAKAASALSIRIVWSPATADAVAHTVRWSVDALAMAEGTGTTAAGTTTAFTGTSQANGTTNIQHIEPATQILASTNADDVIRLNIRRLGADAADTYVGTVNFVGCFLDYTATQ